MIGNRDYWGLGYGTDSVNALLGHIFTTTTLDRVYLHTLDWNVRAQRAFAKSGFREVQASQAQRAGLPADGHPTRGLGQQQRSQAGVATDRRPNVLRKLAVRSARMAPGSARVAAEPWPTLSRKQKLRPDEPPLRTSRTTWCRPSFVTLFCCLPFGIVSIVHAAQVNGKVEAGDRRGRSTGPPPTRRCGRGYPSERGWPFPRCCWRHSSPHCELAVAEALTLLGRPISPRVTYVGFGSLGLRGSCRAARRRPPEPWQLPGLSVPGSDRVLLPRLRHAACPAWADVRGCLGRARLQPAHGASRCPSSAYSFAAGALRAFDLPAPRPLFIHSRWIWAPAGGYPLVLGAQERARRSTDRPGPVVLPLSQIRHFANGNPFPGNHRGTAQCQLADRLLLTAGAPLGIIDRGEVDVPKRTYQPKKRRRSRVHGFRSRMQTRGGRSIIKRRMFKGRHRLTV